MIRRRATYVARVCGALLRDPHEGLERVRDVLADRKEAPGRPYRYESDADWHRSVHELCAFPWPCTAETAFRSLWSKLVREMATHGLVLGRGSFGGWDDAGPALALAAYCLARHLRPQKIVETGVAHGVTTRFLLEALDRNRYGALWSIDLPPLVATDLHEEIAVAVPEWIRTRWTLCLGSSRRRLPGLLDQLGSIGLFVHDSMHTHRNVRFELDQAWSSLTPGGAIVVDDIDFNLGFQRFVNEAPEARSLVAQHDDLQRLFGIVLKEPLQVHSTASLLRRQPPPRTRLD